MKTKLRKIKQYTELLSQLIWLNKQPVSGIMTAPCGYKTGHTPPPLDAMQPYECGDFWGDGNDSHAWFRFAVESEKDTYLRVETERNGWDASNPQFIIYINGKLIQGLDTNHREVPLPENEICDVALYAYTGPKIPKAQLFVSTLQFCKPVWDLYHDVLYPSDLLESLDPEGMEYSLIIDYLWRAVSMLELYDTASEEFLESVNAAHHFLENEFYGKFCDPAQGTTVAIGHTHIDCAWKWTLKQTREKVQRSFATVLALMERYPDYKFMSSQPFLYKNLKEEAPQLYEKVAQQIKNGRWECEGAMWVEPDCNLPSGESLVRQLLYGKNFFKKEFGIDNHILWLPDVFGYSAALPQILRKSGVDWFVTSKISWNDTNRIPFDTFRWKGIDGTSINTHFITARSDNAGPTGQRCTYVGHSTSKMARGTMRRYGQKNIHNEALLTFGYGDGGGGPTPKHLEFAMRGEKGIPGAPKMKIDFAGDYLKRLEKSMESRADVPAWQGELYLEYHRGTYTTMSRNKRDNRKCEFLLQNAELLGTIAATLQNKEYPQDALHEAWEIMLVNQFHDIIPGSSIEEVYDQSDIDYAKVKETGKRIVDTAQKQIADDIQKERGYVVFNPHSFRTEGMVTIDGVSAFTKQAIPAKGYLATDAFIKENNISINGNTVETNALKVIFDEHWQIISIYDKQSDRELLNGIGNELRVYADYPDMYDAWEWQQYSLEKYRTITGVDEMAVIDDGIRKGIRIKRPYMHSVIHQTIWFYDDLKRIDFETNIDWHDQHQMLKTAFPVDINTDKATYDIQFGSLERPTHKNTSWDAAKFEVCGHKYADISDGGYGVSLMNDCKYGYDIHDSVMQLSILRSPTDPNPVADQGQIPVTYSLVLHEGSLSDSDVIKQAYYLNEPMVAIPANGETDRISPEFSAVSVDRENVICETVKMAENDEDTVIRLYESKNRRTHAAISLGIPAKHVYLCDLMENPIEELTIQNGKINVTFGGFEIVTLKIKA